MRAHAFVRGDVQGVGFRYFVERSAGRAGLSGWVRNTEDGRVECVIEGERPAVDRLLERLREGPRSASVDGVDVDWGPPRGETSFRVVY